MTPTTHQIITSAITGPSAAVVRGVIGPGQTLAGAVWPGDEPPMMPVPTKPTPKNPPLAVGATSK